MESGPEKSVLFWIDDRFLAPSSTGGNDSRYSFFQNHRSLRGPIAIGIKRWLRLSKPPTIYNFLLPRFWPWIGMAPLSATAAGFSFSAAATGLTAPGATAPWESSIFIGFRIIFRAGAQLIRQRHFRHILPHQGFDAGKFLLVALVNESNGRARLGGTGRTANPVNVIFWVRRCIIIHHQADALHINATR